MKNPKSMEGWEKEFDEKFTEVSDGFRILKKGVGEYGRMEDPIITDFKSFISNLLNSQKEGITKKQWKY